MKGFLPLVCSCSLDMDVTNHVTIVWLMLWFERVCCLGTGLIREDDICGTHNGRRLYLEQGEHGILTAKNVSVSSRLPNSLQSHEQCSLEVVTCPSCIIVVRFRNLALSTQCGGSLMHSPCRCDYLWLSEPPYDDVVSGTPFCGHLPSPSKPPIFRSQTRTLVFALLYSQAHKHAFTLEYSSEKNRQYIKGAPGGESVVGGNISTGGTFSSPFFPAQYPRDLGSEYIINCQADNSLNCRIRLIFNDFQLSGVSIMEFYDWNGHRLDVSSGSTFRPPVIITSGPSLLIRFYANGGSGTGYKASYSFITGHFEGNEAEPITDCGGYVENLGGAITMMNMVERGGPVKLYDCIWLIRPPSNYYHLKTDIYLKVSTFLDMGNTELTVRQGLTSEGTVLETVRHPVAQLGMSRPRREHLLPLNVGFYVSLRGSFSSASRLAIVYTAFTYMDCFTGSDFLCQNHRCIPAQLNCDGFDHCGDNSDEPDTCTREWEAEPLDRSWYSHTPNYYFPKMDRYPDLKTATLVFIISSLGLIFLIAALVILLYRMGARARQQRELQNRLQTISELLDGARIEEVQPDEPPDYEAPPDYEEVIKRKGSLRRKKKHRRTRSSPGRVPDPVVATETHTSIEVSLPPDINRLIASPPSQPTPVPDSPPPPYADNLVIIPSTSTPELLPAESAEIHDWVEQTSRVFNADTLPTDVAVILASSTQIHPHDSPQAECSQSNNSLINIDCTAPCNDDVFNSESTSEGICARNPLIANNESIFIRRFEKAQRKRKGYSLDINQLIDPNCECKGACGCAVTAARSTCTDVTHPATWSPASYSLRALDMYFSQLEIGSRGQGQPSQLRLWKSKDGNTLSLSVSSSVDNLRDIV